MDAYKTILYQSSHEFTQKRSKFIANIKPVKSEDEAVSFINEIKAKYFDAKHNVYAYLIKEHNISRYSDDGEPQGTAGVPVLEVIKKHDLKDIAVVVTRYFGGILLGTGGLVRAYSAACKNVIETANIVTMHPCYKANIKCDYSLYGKVSALILDNGGNIFSSQFLDCTDILFYFKIDKFTEFQKKLSEISAGSLSANIISKEYFAL